MNVYITRRKVMYSFNEKISKSDVEALKASNDVNEEERSLLHRYLRQYDKKKGVFIVNYYKSKKGFGRVSAGPGLCLMSKKIRGALARDMNYDIDIVNCYFSLLAYEFKRIGIECSTLTSYVENRNDFYLTNNPLGLTFEIFKKQMCAMLNSETYIGPDTLECRKFHSKVYGDYYSKASKEDEKLKMLTYAKRQAREKGNGNIKGKFISYCMEELEAKILDTVIDFLGNNSLIQIGALCYDGFMVEKTISEEYINTTLIPDLEGMVKTKLGIDIKYKLKPLDETLEIPIAQNNSLVEPHREYDFVKAREEKRMAKITYNDLYVIIDDVDNATHLWSVSRLSRAFTEIAFDFWDAKYCKVRTTSFIDAWTSDENLRKYRIIKNYARQEDCPDDVYNIWDPFAFEKITDWTPHPYGLYTIKKQLLVLCGNDAKTFDWLWKWMAQMVQYPDIKSGKCPVFISNEGAGKGWFQHLLEQILGKSKVMTSTSPERDVYGSFNAPMATSFLVILNELEISQMRGLMGKMKGLTTDTEMWVNDKGMSQVKLDSWHRFVVTTNKPEPLETTKGERRNVFIRCSDELCGDDHKAHWDMVWDLLKDNDVIKTVAEDLMAVPDMDKFRKLPHPLTNYAINLQDQSKPVIECWMEEVLMDERYINKIELTMTGREYLDLFDEYRRTHGFTIYTLSSRSLTSKMKNAWPNEVIIDRNSGNGTRYTIKLSGLRSKLLCEF